MVGRCRPLWSVSYTLQRSVASLAEFRLRQALSNYIRYLIDHNRCNILYVFNAVIFDFIICIRCIVMILLYELNKATAWQGSCVSPSKSVFRVRNYWIYFAKMRSSSGFLVKCCFLFLCFVPTQHNLKMKLNAEKLPTVWKWNLKIPFSNAIHRFMTMLLLI